MRRTMLVGLLVLGLAGQAPATEEAATPTPVSTPEATVNLAELQPEALLQPSAGLKQGRLVVRIQKIRNPRGDVWVGLFSGPAGFPDLQRARHRSVAIRKSNFAEAVFTNLPYGSYAIATFHDEDLNMKLTKHWLGMVREGTGVSNNPLKINYENARFELDAPEVQLLIDLVYPGNKTVGGN